MVVNVPQMYRNINTDIKFYFVEDESGDYIQVELDQNEKPIGAWNRIIRTDIEETLRQYELIPDHNTLFTFNGTEFVEIQKPNI